MNFETYCERYNQFLDAVALKLIVKYGDPIHEFTATVQHMCDIWSLSDDELALQVFINFNFPATAGDLLEYLPSAPLRSKSKGYRQSDS